MAHTMETAVVLSQEPLSDDIFSMWIQTEDIAANAVPGQFISVYTRDSSRLLPRPISICEINKEKNTLRIVYRVVGEGTEEFSSYQPGETVRILGPLGNGFPLLDKKAVCIGGGIGIPPMLELMKQLPTSEKTAVLGYRDILFMNTEFEHYGNVEIASEDGLHGTKGNVLNAIEEKGITCDVIYACGPLPMLRAIKKYAEEKNITCYVSMEERMACGVGACLACVCKTKDVDSHSHANNKRICKDGPVFLSTEVEL